MKLKPEQIDSAYRKVWSTVPHAQRLSAFALEIEAEVRKDDEALIRQMLDALDGAIAITMGKIDLRNAAIAAARERLGGQHGTE